MLSKLVRYGGGGDSVIP